MKKKNVIKTYREFKQILDQRKFKRNKLFTVYFDDRKFDYSRAGILITKKHGNAVRRNKIKRQVREIITSTLTFNENYDFIVTISKAYDTDEFLSNLENLSELLKAIKGETNE